MQSSLFESDTANNIPINSDLKCGEEWTVHNVDYDDEEDDDHFAPITFHITLPTQVRLDFNCRDKSSGVLLPTSELKLPERDEGDDNNMNDPFFFERGFSLEAKTGWQVWPGSRLMIEAFTCNSKNERLQHWQTRLIGLKILELGSGIGLVGVSLAAAGGNVVITDLPVLVNHAIIPNIKRNASAIEQGEGSAKGLVLDWFKPISEQLSRDQIRSFDVLVACDGLFLKKLIDPFLDRISELFAQSPAKSLLFTYQRRNMLGLFTTLEDLMERIERRGWGIACLAWRTIVVEDDGEHTLFLFEVIGGQTSQVNNEKQEEKKED